MLYVLIKLVGVVINNCTCTCFFTCVVFIKWHQYAIMIDQYNIMYDSIRIMDQVNLYQSPNIRTW